jgi:ribosome silencing factor RsfS/YbeB/iojap
VPIDKKAADGAKAKALSKPKADSKPKARATAKKGTPALPTVGKPRRAGARAPRIDDAEADPVKLAAARMASLRKIVVEALDDMKALEVKVLDVRGLTDVADTMVIASGTSDRHVRSVAKNVVEKTKAAGFRPHGVEGQQDSDWVLIDLHDMIVHVMLPRTREFYGLEKLWDMTVTKRAARA